jgi:hypothetical protein
MGKHLRLTGRRLPSHPIAMLQGAVTATKDDVPVGVQVDIDNVAGAR